MGKLAHLMDVKASRLEAFFPTMIAKAIEATIAPLREEVAGQHYKLSNIALRLATLTARGEEREKYEGIVTYLVSIWTNITDWRRDVHELRSTNIYMLLGGVDAPEGTSSEVPPIHGVVSYKAPLSSTIRVNADAADNDEEPSETNEEDLVETEHHVEDTYEAIDDLEDIQLQVKVEGSLIDPSFEEPPPALPSEKSGTDALV